jgi:S-adenosylmethionine synthetase
VKYFSSEAVTEGHPDKLADQISDTLLDAILEQDPRARVAIETMLTTGLVHVAGEVTTDAWIDIPALIRAKLLAIGYDDAEKGFDGRSCGISVSIGAQSPDIARGVDRSYDSRDLDIADPYSKQGAGDQGMMFGYATRETAELMPLPITMAHELATQLTAVRKLGVLPYLRPDGKTQVTIGYEGDQPVKIDTIVISAQHAPEINATRLYRDIVLSVIDPVLAAHPKLDASDTKILINPTGSFTIGGPQGDAGLTGRKIIVDTYGGMARHGGGAFSGKDPSKVDRSGAYAARWVAKNLVHAGIARKAEVQIAYAIGVAEPVAIYVDTHGTGQATDEMIARGIRRSFDLRPAAIIEALDLLTPRYAATATGGHFGRPEFPWEATEHADILTSNIH